MSKNLEKAKEFHQKGFNCAQSVALAFCEELGLDEKIISAAAEGFGAGIGGRKEACGALSGAVMIAGLITSDKDMEAPKSKMQTYKIASEMREKFLEHCGSTICAEIKDGENGEPLISCEECIAYGVKLVEEMLG